jgi:hypothetical protein
MNSGAQFLIDLFGASTTDPLFITSLLNDKSLNEKNPPRVAISLAGAGASHNIERFIKKHDLPGRAVYFCVNPIKKGQSLA